MLTASDTMTADPETIGEDEDLCNAAKIIVAHKISGLPVLNEKKELTGIVTKSDILKAISQMD